MDENVVAQIELRVRKGDYGSLVWTAGDHEAGSAREVLERFGSEMDQALAMVPGFGWDER